MKIPHTINANYFKEYQPSDAALKLVADAQRNIKSEDPTWDALHPPMLRELCVMAIVSNFEKNVILNELPCWDKNFLLEILPTDLPLPLVVEHISEEIYWKRKVKVRWKDDSNYVQDYGFDWKRMFLERHVQEAVEAMTPEGFDIEQVIQLCELTKDHVKRLDLKQLQIMQGNVYSEDDDREDEFNMLPPPSDHIDLGPIIRGLTNLTEFHLQFGLRNVGSDYKKSDFQFSIQDCRSADWGVRLVLVKCEYLKCFRKLGAGIAKSESLKLLRVHSCNMDDARLIALLSSMEDNVSLEAFDFSNCKIGSDGVVGIAKYIKNRKNIKKIVLSNNVIGADGVAALSFIMTQPSSSPIEYLDLKFNSISDEGLKYLASALVREFTKIQVLILACCNLGEESAILLGEVLNRNTLITNMDLSNNNLGEGGGRALEMAVMYNKTIQFLDVRMTGVDKKQFYNINRTLRFNRIRSLKGERGVEREMKRLEKKAEEEELRLEEEAREAALEAAERLAEVEEETVAEESKEY